MQPLNFEEVLERITARDRRYDREAYRYLREALDFTQKTLQENLRSDPRHVTGQELMIGLRDYALAQFGPMAKSVLNEWGIHACEDFGELVFNMIDHGLLAKTDKDSREDFKGGFDFDEAFVKPFRPRQSAESPAPQQTKAGST